MRRTWIATALVAVIGAGMAAPTPAVAGGKPTYEDIGFNQQQQTPPPRGKSFDYSQGYDYGKGKNNPNAYGTDNWGAYVDQSQYQSNDQYLQYGQTDQFGQYQFDQAGQSSYEVDFGGSNYGKGGGRSYYPNDPGYDYNNRHQFTPEQKRGFFDYDFGRRMLVGTAADTGGYLVRDAVSGVDIDGRRVAGAATAGGIENFADYAGNYDRRNDAGARIASNAIGYGVGNMAYHGISGDGVDGKYIAGGAVEGGIVGFGKYMGDEEPSAVNGVFWGGLTRFGGALANRGISGEKMDGGAIGGEGLRAVIGALGYMGGNEQ